MQLTFFLSIFSMYARIAGADSKAEKPEINIIKPEFNRVGIKFDNISVEKLFPGLLVLKNIHGLIL